MNGLGLSAEALEARRRYVQAGDAAKIMAGQWRDVWREKMGFVTGDDLSAILAVQMGSFTEPFNLAWCEKQTGREVEYYSDNPICGSIWSKLTNRFVRPELRVSRAYLFMACNLDGMTTTARGERCVVDAKHVGRSDDPMILRYTAAGTHQATVMGCDFWALSVFVGNSKWEYIEQEVDPIYQAQLIAKEREFWGYVERGEEPPEDAAEPALPPKPQPKLRKLLVPTEGEVHDAMVRQENWLAPAIPEIVAFIGTDAAAKRNAIAREALKVGVPEDVGELIFGRYTRKRSKAGAVTMTVAKLEDYDAL